MNVEQWACSVCGKVGPGRIPKGGDGSEIFPTRHKHGGKLCVGYCEAAQLVKPSGDDTTTCVYYQIMGEDDWVGECETIIPDKEHLLALSRCPTCKRPIFILEP